MSAQTSRISGAIALTTLRLVLLGTAATLLGVVGHVVWKIVAP
ncbi:MAG: hypothetical protein WCP77_03855 [Roseococcus sp.]